MDKLSTKVDANYWNKKKAANESLTALLYFNKSIS